MRILQIVLAVLLILSPTITLSEDQELWAYEKLHMVCLITYLEKYTLDEITWDLVDDASLRCAPIARRVSEKYNEATAMVMIFKNRGDLWRLLKEE